MIAPDARVLAIVVARIGDTLLATPALRALRAACPQGELTVLAHPRRLELLLHLPFIDRLGGITKARAFWRGRLGVRPRYDCAVVYGHDEALVRYALRVAARVVAFRQGDNRLNARLSTVVDEPQALEHAVLARLRPLSALGIPNWERRLAYAVTEAESAAARSRLAGLFSGQPRPLVGLQLQSFPTKAYRDWPVGHFRELLQRLFSRWPQARAVILGGKESCTAAQDFCRDFPQRVAALTGRLTLRETAAVMAKLDLYVGVDTGPTHLAGALGIPMVVLYHCRHRGEFLAPLQHPRATVLEHPATDAECSNASAMAEIGVDRVWRAVEEQLGMDVAVA